MGRITDWAEKVWRRNKRTRRIIERALPPILEASILKHVGDALPTETKGAIAADIMGEINEALRR